jgi:hypothetical protein
MDAGLAGQRDLSSFVASVPSSSRTRLPWRRIVTSVPFRLFVATVTLLFHLFAFKTLAADRIGIPFNSAPNHAPAFDYPDQPAPSFWNRIIVSRWDSQHYIDILERGYSRCAPEDLRGVDLNPYMLRCGFNFYPGYAMVGRLVAKLLHAPADYALLGVALAASFAFVFLWTGPALTSTLGVGTTYLSLLLFNLFTTGFALVTIQTEPLALLSALCAFLCLRRRWWLLGALIAGAGGAIRITGPSIGAGYGIALLAHAILNREDRPLVRWGRLFAAAPLCVWGQLTIFAFFGWKYKDPLLYVHGHSQAYSHHVNVLEAIFPSPDMAMRSLTMGLHEGLFVFLGLFWLALGMRRGLAPFPTVERVYWYATSFFVLGIGLVGSAGLAYGGMNRYFLLVLPLFFGMATVLRRRPLALFVWAAFSFWHYWNVDLCVFLAQRDTPHYCNMSYIP